MFKKHPTEPTVFTPEPEPTPAAAPMRETPKAAARSGNPSCIGESLKITGEVSGSEDLMLQGEVEGRISLSNNTVTIGAGGSLVGDVVAKVVRVEGSVQGDVTGLEQVIVHRSGTVRGNISAPRMTLEDGAKLKGTIDMDPKEQSGAKSAPKKEMKAASGNSDTDSLGFAKVQSPTGVQ